MIKKIFRFDKQMAKENKCCASLVETILVLVLLIGSTIVFSLLGYVIDLSLNTNCVFLPLFVCLWIVVCVLIGLQYDSYVIARRSCFVVDGNDRIYILRDRVDSSSSLLGGAFADINVEQLVSKKDNFLTNLYNDLKYFLSFFKMESSYKNMQDEQYIKDIYKKAGSSLSYGKYQLYAISEIDEFNNYYIIKCKCINIRSHQQIDNYKFKLYKAYQDFDELLSLLDEE